jgi:hypothetical protein
MAPSLFVLSPELIFITATLCFPEFQLALISISTTPYLSMHAVRSASQSITLQWPVFDILCIISLAVAKMIVTLTHRARTSCDVVTH